MTSTNVKNKRLMMEYYKSIYGANEDNVGRILKGYFPEDTTFD